MRRRRRATATTTATATAGAGNVPNLILNHQRPLLQQHHDYVVNALLVAGAQADLSDHEGFTVLSYAAMKGRVGITGIELLIRVGAFLDIVIIIIIIIIVVVVVVVGIPKNCWLPELTFADGQLLPPVMLVFILVFIFIFILLFILSPLKYCAFILSPLKYCAWAILSPLKY